MNFPHLIDAEAKQTHLRPLVSWNYRDKNLSSSSNATSYIIIYEVVNNREIQKKYLKIWEHNIGWVATAKPTDSLC